MPIADACAAWAAALAPDRVSRDANVVAKYGRSTLVEAPQPLAVLRPTCRDEVVAAVKIASQHAVPLYPISRGRNWGLGAACPPTAGQAVLDLSLMNKIVEVNEELAYAVIEPGVTQGQLAEYLDDNEIDLMLDCTGAGRDVSIVGNCLERGDTFGVYADRFLHCSALEVVLPNGDVITTGLGHLDAAATNLYKWGVGPSLDGLFSQSNFGVVTRLTLELMPEPETMSVYFFGVEDEQLEDLIEALRPLRLSGVIHTALHLANDYKALAAMEFYPWDETNGQTPLPESVRRRMRARYPFIQGWIGNSAFYGTHDQVQAQQRELKRALRGITRVQFVTPRKLEWGLRALRVLARTRLPVVDRLGTLVERARTMLTLMAGIPSNNTLLGTQWRLRREPHEESLDPLDNGIGMYWFAPICPLTGEHVRRLQRLIEEISAEYQFEPMLNLTLLTGRAALLTNVVLYDRDDASERERAARCNNALVERGIAAGYPPFRCSIDSFRHLGANDSPYWRFVRQLKRAADPEGVIAPGRYSPWVFHDAS